MKKKTSLIAWERVKKSLSPRRRMVAVQIRKKPGSTIRDVAKALRLEKNIISGRFSELERLKVIKEAGLKYYPKSSQPHTKWVIK
jgi:predicted transcriptional regulator